MKATSATPLPEVRLPDDIEAKIAACEQLVDADTAKIDETLESLDGAPIALLEDDTSLVHHIEDVRIAARRSRRVASTSKPPATHAAKAR